MSSTLELSFKKKDRLPSTGKDISTVLPKGKEMDLIKFQSHCQPFKTGCESEAGHPICLLSRDCCTFYFFASALDRFLVYCRPCLSYGEIWKWNKAGNKSLDWILSKRDLLFGRRIQQKKVKIVAKIWFELHVHFCNPVLDQIQATVNAAMVIADQTIWKRRCSS